MFRDFAMFDTLIRPETVRSPIIFFCIMGFFALICYVFRSHADQAVLMGNVLLGIGILLPVGYLLNFYLSVRAQAKKLKLDPPRLVYTLNFTRAEDGITVTSPNTSEGTLPLELEQPLRRMAGKRSDLFLFLRASGISAPGRSGNCVGGCTLGVFE